MLAQPTAHLLHAPRHQRRCRPLPARLAPARFPYFLCILLVAVLLQHPASALARDPSVLDGLALAQRGVSANLCALTFDDGPGQTTEALLDILRDKGVRGTFFVVGSRVHRYPETLKRLVAEGNEVGNHTFTHVSLRQRQPVEQLSEIARTNGELAKLGIVPRYLRPPYGRYDNATIDAAAAQGMTIALWSVDSRDWRKHDLAAVLPRKVYGVLGVRGVFLFHDNHRETVEALPNLIDRLSEAGCTFVTMSEYVETSGPLCLH
ncbi:polysaccharide deacetylase family protein [Desulfovibrio oxamicus]|uniref:Polysaccharide deacetylase family protein n=1 Tax=Nitratidesulfovibrio oxamicus TaxID=32016 RepID=A0ABS0J660_9BACT|nr:polysaccharide deacetylase family protein [Nitratidesulfovibrio oxamicus]MBG3877625.1 polysaccharide deacetylase family protein [Nitratidesulfovibrio oxamicus]